MNSILYNCCTDHRAPDWKLFDALELHGIFIDDEGTSHHTTGDDANTWSVFGHLREGGLEPITDCTTLEKAKDVCKRLAFVSGLPVTYSL